MDWKLETRLISEITINVKNPRKMGKRQAEELQVSLKKFGLCQPIVLNNQGGIIGGHQRVRAMRALGHKSVEVYVPCSTLTAEEQEELTIRLNKNLGEWDFDLLGNHWDPERLVEWGFSLDELHLEELPESTEPPKIFSLTITCPDQNQLELIEKHIETLVQDFSGARYKVKVK